MRKWIGSLVLAGAVGVAGCGDPAGEGSEDLLEAATPARDGDRDGRRKDGKDREGADRDGKERGHGRNECREVEKICKTINSHRNITHVFLDLPACFDPDAVVKVVAYDKWDREKQIIDWKELKKRGGPCEDGRDGVERDLWFPLQGDQSEAKICVFLEPDGWDRVPEDVAIGFKAGGHCEADRWADLECRSCKVEKERACRHHRDDCDCDERNGKDRHDGKQGGGHGKDRHDGKKGDGYGKDRHDGKKGGGYGKDRHDGKKGGGHGKDRHDGKKGDGYGKDRHDGKKGGGYGKDRHDGKKGGGHGKDRHDGKKGDGYGKDRHDGKKGGGYGKDRHDGKKGDGYGKDRHDGKKGDGYGKDRDDGKKGDGYGKDRHDGKKGDGYGKDRDGGKGERDGCHDRCENGRWSFGGR